MEIAILSEDRKQLNEMVLVLEEHYPNRNIHVFSTVSNYHKSDKHYDLLIFEVGLNFQDTIDYLRHHDQKQTLIILVVSHIEEVLDFFYSSMVGFVLKESVSKVLLNKVKTAEDLLKADKKYSFKSERGEILIQEDRILFMYFEDGFVYLKLKHMEKAVILNNRSLKELGVLLSEVFFQVNRNYIVNMKEITEINTKVHKVYFTNLHQISVSKRNWATFIKNYYSMKYM